MYNGGGEGMKENIKSKKNIYIVVCYPVVGGSLEEPHVHSHLLKQ
jgi:hypothetical protein